MGTRRPAMQQLCSAALATALTLGPGGALAGTRTIGTFGACAGFGAATTDDSRSAAFPRAGRTTATSASNTGKAGVFHRSADQAGLADPGGHAGSGVAPIRPAESLDGHRKRLPG